MNTYKNQQQQQQQQARLITSFLTFGGQFIMKMEELKEFKQIYEKTSTNWKKKISSALKKEECQFSIDVLGGKFLYPINNSTEAQKDETVGRKSISWKSY